METLSDEKKLICKLKAQSAKYYKALKRVNKKLDKWAKKRKLCYIRITNELLYNDDIPITKALNELKLVVVGILNERPGGHDKPITDTYYLVWGPDLEPVAEETEIPVAIIDVNVFSVPGVPGSTVEYSLVFR